jgi:hypothetical protein
MSEPALIGFPSNPTVDEEHDGWVWDGTKWVQIETPAFEIDDDHLLKKAEDNIVPAEFAIHVAGGAMFKSNSIGWDDVTEVRYTGIETTGAVIAGSFVGDGSALTNLPIQIPDSYTKSESDAKYQLQGDYALNGASYTKSESDGKYQLIGDYALNGASYTKVESDAAYQPAGNYAPDGNYAVVGASYTKAESDSKWQPKGSYQPAGNYALVGASYTKAESNAAYQAKGSYAASNHNHSGVYAPASHSHNYAAIGASYTKAESDGKYELKGQGGGGNFVPLSGNSTIAGTLTATDFVASSDVRLKTNIKRAPLGMLDKIEAREWDWKESGQKSAGVVAQELEAAGLDHLVHEDEKGFKAVAYNGLIGYMITEIKALRSELEDLKK